MLRRTPARNSVARCALALALVAACASCGTHASTTSVSPSDAGPSLNVPSDSCPEAGTIASTDAASCVVHTAREFSRDIVPLFERCAGEICHDFGGGKISSQIGVGASECCNQLQMIEPGHPERSYVLLKLLGRDVCGGSAMPLDKQGLEAAETQAIADWICQGADINN